MSKGMPRLESRGEVFMIFHSIIRSLNLEVSAELWNASETIFSKVSGDILNEDRFVVHTVEIPFSKLEPRWNVPPLMVVLLASLNIFRRPLVP